MDRRFRWSALFGEGQQNWQRAKSPLALRLTFLLMHARCRSDQESLDIEVNCNREQEEHRLPSARDPSDDLAQ